MTEDQLEQEALGWLTDVGWQHRFGPDLAPDGGAPERTSYRDVLLIDRLRRAIRNLNPNIPQAAREDAIAQLLSLGLPHLLAANRQFHRLLVGGVPVQYQKDGETLGDFVRMLDWAKPGRNEWLAVNQFSIQGPKHTRRPDIILFVNGLPLVLLELKNPADLNADVWKAYDQIQTYKEQIADTFQYNEVLVISDGTDTLLGSLSADPERFMAWRTIDGVTLDPLGPFNELQTLVRGVLAPAYLLDYLRYFVLFEDDGTLVKKIAGYHQFHAVRSAIQQVVAASRADGLPNIRGKGGVVWHTQGSGKSITMTCFAANHVLGIEDGKRRFADTSLAMSQAFTLCCTLEEAKAVREEVAFMQGVKVILTKRDVATQKKANEARELAIRQIINSAVVSESVVDIFDAVGLEKPNIGILDDAFLAEVRNLPERNLAVELLERLLESEIKSKFASNVVQHKKFSDLLTDVVARYQNRSIEAAQVMEELVQMAKKFREAAARGQQLGLTEDEVKFNDALATNESAVRELSDETLKIIAHELAENLRKNLTVDWSQRESVQAKLRLMVKWILRKYKYPPDMQDAAVELVLEQAKALGEAWA
jgi:type I site-specific restriction-modification system R (restriction) subunit